MVGEFGRKKKLEEKKGMGGAGEETGAGEVMEAGAEMGRRRI